MDKDPKILKSPRFGQYLLKKSLSHGYGRNIIGDFEEEYKRIYVRDGRFVSTIWYWSNILKSLPAFIVNSFFWGSAMFKNYLKSAIRNFNKNRVNSAINLFGLSLGIASCILIFLFIRNEITYDSFHDEHEDIYLITRKVEGQWGNKLYANLPLPLGPELIKDYPEIRYGVRILKSSTNVKNDTDENSEAIYYVDPDFINVFSFEMLSGDRENVLNSPDKILVSRQLSEKYFNSMDMTGESILLKITGEYEPFVIGGIFENFPENSSIKPDIILPFETARRHIGDDMFSDWQRYTPVFIVKLIKGVNIENLQNKFPDIIEKYGLHADLTSLGVGRFTGTLELANFSEFHLDQDIVETGYLEPQSTAVYSFIMGALGLLILAIACINFMNLSISQSMKRAKEVGIRKVVGACRKQLIHQFFIETMLMSVAAFAFGLVISQFLLPVFNSLANLNLKLDFLGEINTVLMFASLILLVGIISGAYPALFLSRFKPVAALKEEKKFGGSSYITRALIILQFTFSVALIITAVNMSRQLNYIGNKNLGYDKDNVIVLNTQNNILPTLKQELASSSNVQRITGSTAAIYRNFVGMTAFKDAANDAFTVYQSFNTDYDFKETMGIEMLSGRYFSKNHPSDLNDAVIINKAMADLHNFDDPVGKQLRVSYNKEREIIGVIKDFHYKSLHTEIQPLIIKLKTDSLNRIYVKINGDNIENSLGEIENVWNKVNPEETFNYRFVDESLAVLYSEERNWSRIINYSMVFAILIACLGLYGMSSLIAVYRTKEFGIRKILGASILTLLRSFNVEFMLLILTANVVAWPLCYIVVKRWLENFAYKIDMDISTFIAGALISIFITLTTVSIQALKAAAANPVRNLRNE
ncbi:ABC transporter permease [candidate division KSB1 bacterium]